VPGSPVVRLAQVLLIVAAVTAVGSAFIARDTSGLGTLLGFFILAAVLFGLAAARVGSDAPLARWLAASGMLALTGIAILAGIASNWSTLWAAPVGIVGGWAAQLVPPRRVVVLTTWIPLGLGAWWLALSLLGGFAAAGEVVVYAALVASVAIPGALIATRRLRFPRLSPAASFVLALGFGGAGTGVLFIQALSHPETSARFELATPALALVFAASALVGAGIAGLSTVPNRALVALGVGLPIVIYALASAPTVECRPNSVRTTGGPWWMLPSGFASGGASEIDAVGNGSGKIIRTDGHIIQFVCDHGRVATFSIE
jgi:hypothetical protein